jgi:hypothetical protein
LKTGFHPGKNKKAAFAFPFYSMNEAGKPLIARILSSKGSGYSPFPLD